MSATTQNENILKIIEITEEDDLSKSEEMIKMLVKGEIFTKYGKFGEPHLKVISVTPDLSKIIWKVPSACSLVTPLKEMEVIDVRIDNIS